MDMETIYRLYFRDVYLFLQGLTRSETLAEELTQETFFKALDGLKNFDGKQDVRAWLFTVARNAYYSHCRRTKHTAPLEDAETARGPPTRRTLPSCWWTRMPPLRCTSACTRWKNPIKRCSACGCSASCPLRTSEPFLATMPPGHG